MQKTSKVRTHELLYLDHIIGNMRSIDDTFISEIPFPGYKGKYNSSVDGHDLPPSWDQITMRKIYPDLTRISTRTQCLEYTSLCWLRRKGS